MKVNRSASEHFRPEQVRVDWWILLEIRLNRGGRIVTLGEPLNRLRRQIRRTASFGTVLAPLLLLAAPSALAQPGFDPREFRADVEVPTPVLVLGTPHLSQLQDFEVSWLEPLLTRLEAFAPAVIAVENLSGESLGALSEYSALHPDVATMFGKTALDLAAQAQAELGISRAAAEAGARKLLANWPKRPTAADRRRLSALFLAAADPASALVQWLRLPAEERRPADGLTAELGRRLDRLAASRNETYSVAVKLAVRLGLERVFPMDDHSESDLAFEAMDLVSEAERSPDLAAERERLPMPPVPPMTSPESVLEAYRQINLPATGRADAEHQWRTRLRMKTHRDTHRRRAAAWETRNLRMAAHIREASARHPGKPVLVIVGSAHKPYLDSYLNMMSDMEVVQAAAVLAGSATAVAAVPKDKSQAASNN